MGTFVLWTRSFALIILGVKPEVGKGRGEW